MHEANNQIVSRHQSTSHRLVRIKFFGSAKVLKERLLKKNLNFVGEHPLVHLSCTVVIKKIGVLDLQVFT